MNHDIDILVADTTDHARVGELIWQLMVELFPEEQAEFVKETFISSAVDLLGRGERSWAFVAKIDGEIVALLTLNECTAIYAGGLFGEISELYVAPEHRSAGIGRRLLKAANDFAARRGWPVLEVGAPRMPKWQRTLDFYEANGFVVIGPRLERSVGRP